VTADQLGRIPDGMKSCRHYNGYGCSLKEALGTLHLLWGQRLGLGRPRVAYRGHNSEEPSRADPDAADRRPYWRGGSDNRIPLTSWRAWSPRSGRWLRLSPALPPLMESLIAQIL
jgi:hypothetical protein